MTGFVLLFQLIEELFHDRIFLSELRMFLETQRTVRGGFCLMNIADVVAQWNTTPFLFIGSGMTRRYLSLPDWRGLLEHFATTINDDPFAYDSYANKAKQSASSVGVMPKLADLLQRDFDERWFADKSIRSLNTDELDCVKQGVSPFKAEIASYIRKNAIINPEYTDEIQALSMLSEKSIAGVITTNYDSFLEDNFHGFAKYIGQNELIFSATQGIAEIYKIHGSIEQPESIVINEEDYIDFDKKSAYLAAKLMTIFMEYPIVFMGYSISDANIVKIIRSIVNCLDEAQLARLEDRFVFVEYKPGMKEIQIEPYTIMIEDKPLTMRRIKLANFLPLYNAMAEKRSKLPVRILRRFKQELYSFTITNAPTSRLTVASIDDTRVSDEELVIAIGKVGEVGFKGLRSITGDDWHRNVILDGTLDFSADELLRHSFHELLKSNSNRLPIHKYLSLAKESHPDCENYAQRRNFDNIISPSISKNRRSVLGNYQSVKQIWEKEKQNIEKATRLIAHLPEDNLDIFEVESILKELFENDVNILQTSPQPVRTNIRRLVMIYDYLKWGKRKEPSD